MRQQLKQIESALERFVSPRTRQHGADLVLLRHGCAFLPGPPLIHSRISIAS